MPIDASMLSGFTKSGMRRLPLVSRLESRENTAKSGKGTPSKAKSFFVIALSCVMKNSPGPPPA